MTEKSQLGNLGEDIACQYLVEKGFKIIGRNYRKPWGEIDIIAKSPDKTLVFVEVKTMQTSGDSANNSAKSLMPEDQLTTAKLQKLQKTSQLYAGQYPKLIKDKKGWRIDLVCIDFYVDENEYDARHYENI